MNEHRACQLGLWSSAFLAVLGIIYMGLLVVSFLIDGLAFPPPPLVQLTGGLVTFLSAPALIILFAAIKDVPGKNEGVLGTLGVSFTLLFAAMVSINRFVQLTVIRMSSPGAASEDLVRFLPYSEGSVMFALEMLGWGFFIALAALSVAPLFRNGLLECWIRWVLISFGALSLISVVGYATGTAVVAFGFLAWGPLLSVLSILLAVFFQRASGHIVDASNTPLQKTQKTGGHMVA